MRVDRLKEYLNTMPDDMEVHVQTTPDDLASPLILDKIKVWGATKYERGGQMVGINNAILVLTAHIPTKD